MNLTDKLKIEGVNSNGYGIMPKIVMQDSRLTIEAKAIYAYIVSYAGAGNTAFPSLKKILADLNISKNRFYKHRLLLIEYNYIVVKSIRNEKKEIIKNIYTLIANPTLPNKGGMVQNDEYPMVQNDEYPMVQNKEHKSNNTKINSITINNKKEASQSSPSFLPDDDDYINTNTQSDKPFPQPNKEKIDTQEQLKQLITNNEHLKAFAVSLLLAGLKEMDCLEILEYLASLPEIDQQVSDIVNAQVRANELEAQTNGLSNYKAYFLKGLKMKLENAAILVNETNITNSNDTKIPKDITLHDWVN